MIGACPNCRQLFSKQRLTPQFFMDGIFRSVKLHENERKPGFSKRLRILFILAKPDAIGV